MKFLLLVSPKTEAVTVAITQASSLLTHDVGSIGEPIGIKVLRVDIPV